MLQGSYDLHEWLELESFTPISFANESGHTLLNIGSVSTGYSFYRLVSKSDPVDDRALPSIYLLFDESVEVVLEGETMVIRSTRVPNHSSPYFAASNSRYQAYNGDNPNWRKNPNRIQAQDLEFRIPVHPAKANRMEPIPLGPIGVSLNGVPFFNQYAGPNQPLTHEINSFDQYNGHPTGFHMYHYHITDEDPYINGSGFYGVPGTVSQ